MKQLRAFIREEDGNISVLMAALLLMLLAFAGLVIDSGLLMEGKMKLHAATKAAAKATIDAYDREIWEEDQEVVIEQEDALNYASYYLSRNLRQARLVSVTTPSNNQVKLITKLKVEFVFMKMFGINNCEVSSTITASGG